MMYVSEARLFAEAVSIREKMSGRVYMLLRCKKPRRSEISSAARVA